MKAKHALIHDTFTLERRYPSAPDKVYRYFSEPEYRKRWFGCTENWSQRSHSLDFRVGGQELEQGAPSGGILITYDSRILDIVPRERIINSYVLAAAGEHPGAAANAWDRSCKTPRPGEVSEAICGPP